MFPEDRRVRTALAVAAVLAAGLLAYAPLPGNSFVGWDDDVLIQLDPVVAGPVGWHTVEGAFSFRKELYWHPLSVLSLAATRAAFGPDPVAFHLENLAWHLAAALVILLALAAATGRLGRATFVAALFAVHPVNVESVAWAAERRNVLAVFLALASAAAYLHWARRGRALAWALSLLLAALAFLAKPLVLVLPGLLLALDAWPLARLRPREPGRWVRLAVEKWPFLLLATVTAVVVDRSLVGYPHEAPRPLALRAANAVVAVARQVLQLVAPLDLAPFHEYPTRIEAGALAASALLLVAITVVAVRSWRSRPYLLAGWAWFLLGMLPSLGLRQVGVWPAFADRHAYLAEVGLLWILVWGAADLSDRILGEGRAARLATGVLGAAVVGTLALATANLVPTWKDSATLFARAVERAPRTAVFRYNLGVALASSTPPRPGDAALQFSEAVRLDPGYYQARTNLGLALLSTGRLDEGLAELREAARTAPDDPQVHLVLGQVLQRLGRGDEAARELARAVELSRARAR